MRKPIRIDEAALCRALGQIAQEDAQRLAAGYEQDTLSVPRRVIDDTFARHRSRALALIRQQTRPARQGIRRLSPLAACLILAAGAGLYALWHQPPAADIPALPLASGTAVIATPSPQQAAVPEGWRGGYYPAWFPQGYTFNTLRDKGAFQEALYESPAGGRLIFAESEEPQHYELQGDETASFSYRQLDGQTVALVVLSRAQGTFVVWDVNGRQTLQVFLAGILDESTALAIAQSVRSVVK